MKEVVATAGNDGLEVIKQILKGAESPKDGAGAGPQEKKVRFADESPALSAEENKAMENKAIKDFSTAFNLKEDRMKKIFQDSKTPEGIQDIDKKYLKEEGEKNAKFKESNFFKELLPENDKNNKSVNSKNQGDGLPEEDPRKKLNNRAEERGDGNKGGEEKKGGNKKLMLALGILFACILLATGGAALPIIGGFLASSQGLFIAGAVGAGLAGAGLFIKDQISQGNNNPGGMAAGQGGGVASAVANEGGPAQEKAQGQGRASENAQASAPAQGQAQAQASENAQASAPAQGQAQAQASENAQASAPAPDLMKLMKQDLQAQLTNEKDILRGFKQELDRNVKLSNLVKDATSNDVDVSNLYKTSTDLSKPAIPNDIKEKLSQVDKIEPDGIAKKSSQALSKDIGIDSKSEKRTLEALNLEMPSSNRPDPSSRSWVDKANNGVSSRGSSGGRV